MNYKISLIKDDLYSVVGQGKTHTVDLDFLKRVLKDYKYQELLEKKSMSARGEWAFPEETVKEPVQEKLVEYHVEREEIGHGYFIEKSKHPDLYELWKHDHKSSLSHFIAYFFKKSSLTALIEEDRCWQSYDKKLTRCIHDLDIPSPEEED